MIADTFTQAEPIGPADEEELAEDHGIVLSATMVSSRVQLATINGRTYQVSDVIVFGEDTPDGTLREEAFQLKEVGPRHAVLQGPGRKIWLELPNSQSTGISITPSH